jgi:hypothetical protein
MPDGGHFSVTSLRCCAMLSLVSREFGFSVADSLSFSMPRSGERATCSRKASDSCLLLSLGFVLQDVPMLLWSRAISAGRSARGARFCTCSGGQRQVSARAGQLGRYGHCLHDGRNYRSSCPGCGEPVCARSREARIRSHRDCGLALMSKGWTPTRCPDLMRFAGEGAALQHRPSANGPHPREGRGGSVVSPDVALTS